MIALPVRPSEEESHPNETEDGQAFLIWEEDGQAADNYRKLGETLANSTTCSGDRGTPTVCYFS